MNRIAPTALAATVLIGGMALAPEAKAHTLEANIVCDGELASGTISGEEWPPVGSTYAMSIETPEGVASADGAFNGGTTETAILAPPGEFTAYLSWTVIGADGFIDSGEIERTLTCYTTPPPTSPETPSDTPTDPPAPPPTSTLPTDSTPEAGTPPSIPVGPDRPTRTVTKRTRTRVVRGCLGPWAKHPRIRGVRAKRGPDGRYYAYRDVRIWTTTYITIRDGDEVRRGRRTKHRIAFLGAYCGPTAPAVTG